MTIKGSYRQFFAAFFLALYVFVATPVTFWHDHDSVTKRKSTADPGEVIVTKSNASPDTNCFACAHKYSTHNDDLPAPFGSSIIKLKAKNGFYHLPAIAELSFTFSNKGPPYIS